MKVIWSWQTIILIITSVLCVTGLEFFALSKGIDGTILTGSIGAIIGIPVWIISGKFKENKLNNGK